MAWNRPVNGDGASAIKRRGRRFPIAIAGLIVALGAAAAAWWLWPSGEMRQDAASTKRGLIKEVTPAATPKLHKPKPGMVFTTNRYGKVIEHPPTNRWGNPWHWGPNARLRPTHTTTVDRASFPLEMRIFHHAADVEIARLLVMEPGTPMIPGIVFDDEFKRSFIESLSDITLVTSDDDEETKAMKRAVNETKADLKARMDAGEDIVKIMNDTRKELVQLGAYREELMNLIEEKERDRSATRQDMEDVVAAANKMLDERGLKPIVMPEFYYQQLELRNQRYKEKHGIINNDKQD